MNLSQLKAIAPMSTNLTPALLDAVNSAMSEFGINTAADQSAFLANVAHETRQFNTYSENLNYSAEQLVKTWPTRFNITTAQQYAKKPIAIANFVYANRFGNGNVASGDGWKYRGGGGLQTTFRDNYAIDAAFFGMAPDAFAEWVRTDVGAMRSAGRYWSRLKISTKANALDFDGCCDLVNLGRKTEKVGDSIGWADRLSIYQRAIKTLS